MSLAGVLFIIFLVLKLVGVIAWSWWWVTSPLWISVIITFVWYVFMVGILGVSVNEINKAFKKKK